MTPQEKAQELLTTKFNTKMKTNYSYNEMKRAFECGRNFQKQIKDE